MPIPRTFLVILAAILASWAGPAWAGQATPVGSIAGKVLFPPTLSTPPANQQVMLHTIKGGEVVNSQSQTLDAEGRFHFRSLVPDPQYTYLVSIRFQGVTYHSDRLILTPEQPSLEQVSLAVYEATEDDAALTIPQDHLIIDVFPTHLRISEVLIVRNSGDKAITSAHFPLPTGFQDFQVSGENLNSLLQADQEGVKPLSPLTPGDRQFLFRYSLPYQGRTFTLSKAYPYPTARVILLLTDPEVTVSGERLTKQEILEMGGRRFRRFDVEGLARNATLNISLHNLGRKGSGLRLSATWIVYGAVGLVILLGFCYPLLRQYRAAPVRAPVEVSLPSPSPQDSPSPEKEEESLPQEDLRSELIRQIALLDEQFEQQRIDPAEYQQKRQQLKEQIVQLTLQRRSRGSGHEQTA